ncbi:hypothetical protein A9Q99_18320 [Gammaproteobacteria bacterium 45_16_T64]|nr:hypothetical protein A9Q99_18320 [Gammaproteobacteria bacterium 45_16_T64]
MQDSRNKAIEQYRQYLLYRGGLLLYELGLFLAEAIGLAVLRWELKSVILRGFGSISELTLIAYIHTMLYIDTVDEM